MNEKFIDLITYLSEILFDACADDNKLKDILNTKNNVKIYTGFMYFPNDEICKKIDYSYISTEEKKYNYIHKNKCFPIYYIFDTIYDGTAIMAIEGKDTHPYEINILFFMNSI